MSMTDPIADLLTRIRNGLMAKLERVDIPASRMKISIARILKEEGYIKNFKLIKDNKQGVLRVFLKYTPENVPVIQGIKRVSKPGCRVYVGSKEILPVLSGLGVGIVSTSKGLMSDREARRRNVGGEMICSVW
ncbi:MAG: 30S ribosomal protein S8 [Thermodesulfobacteriota bacterium]|nr:30S ribosomal protein S8 [Thermodesulfobacteriota bacterium]